MSDNVQYISALTGLVGTVAGSLISYITLKHNFDQDRHRVLVDLGSHFLINVQGIDPKKEHLTVKVANVGNITFTVANVGFNIGRRSGGLVIPVPLGTHPLPVILKRDDTCNFWIDYGEAKKGIRKQTWRNTIRIRAVISDYAGNTFKSSWIRITFKETILMKLWNKVKSGATSILRFIQP